MATVTKNFRIKSGLIVEGATGTINGQNILTETGGNAYILNLVGGATLVKSVESTQLEVSGAGLLSIKSGVFDVAGAAAAAQSAAISAAATDATSKANAAQSAATTAAGTDATTKVAAEAALRVSGDAASVSTAATDATSKADAAQAAAISAAAADATSKANAAQSAATTAAATDATSKANAAQAAAATDATTKANAAQAAAASALSSAISTEVSSRNTAIGAAVDSLVDGAPALLNTLNELAAAINDDANYTTTITTALGTKANSTQVATDIAAEATLRVSGDAASVSTAATDATAKVAAEAALRVSGDAASVSTAAADATAKVAAEAALRAAADTAAIATASADATAKANAAQAAAEATVAAASYAQQNATPSFTAINYNSVARYVAATTGNIVTAAATTAFSWVAADFRSAKLVIKAKNGVHTQVSDLVVTLDTANNVAVSEYGITYSNGTELAAVTADYSGSDVRIRVTPANGNTEVMVVGTLIK